MRSRPSVKEMKLELCSRCGSRRNGKLLAVEALAAQAILFGTYVLEFITDKGGSKLGNADISTDLKRPKPGTQKVNNGLKAVN